MHSARRDDINLTRLIRRLEKAVNGQDWEQPAVSELWLKSLETLQIGAQLASSEDSQRYENIRLSLERFETFLESVQKRSMPQSTKPKPILPSIPQPALDIPNPDPLSEMQGEPPQNTSIISTDSLLTSPFDSPSASIAWPIPTLASPLLPTATKSTAIASGAFLENSKARHEAMSEQLVQMALQLRKNAQNFSEKLVEDKSIVEETQMKLDSNFGVMQKERRFCASRDGDLDTFFGVS
ncbi:hypothetical protein HHX47_DHR8000167 [Lentinula edodes]|nr:hypothetical protein HHX47_DHR8000167 [Lentinula edodes]